MGDTYYASYAMHAGYPLNANIEQKKSTHKEIPDKCYFLSLFPDGDNKRKKTRLNLFD